MPQLMLNGWGKPAEKEWEWASQTGLKNKEYPWANQVPSSSRDNYGRNVGKLTAVGSYPANGYGLYDMTGNVGEWCRDWYDSGKYGRVLRGSNWAYTSNRLRVAYRSYYPGGRASCYGFRCVGVQEGLKVISNRK